LAYYTTEHENLNEKTILRPLIDQRNYKAFLLANDMKVMLISDLDTKNAGAALSIGVGSMSNPYNL
jgi:secreted Zn-dependent insulinase-like peptidase